MLIDHITPHKNDIFILKFKIEIKYDVQLLTVIFGDYERVAATLGNFHPEIFKNSFINNNVMLILSGIFRSGQAPKTQSSTVKSINSYV